jgi:hypothetical protein
MMTWSDVRRNSARDSEGLMRELALVVMRVTLDEGLLELFVVSRTDSEFRAERASRMKTET